MSIGLDLGFWTSRRVNLVRQSEMSECGLACLCMVANYHGLNTDITTMRHRFPPSIRGASLKTLLAIADQIGLIPRAVKLPLDKLSHLTVPAILHWDMSHFVVLERTSSNGRALVHDPAGQTRWYTSEELSKHFTGVALELNAATEFENSTEIRKFRLRELWIKLRGLNRAFAQILVLTLVLQTFVLVSPYYVQVALDSVVPALDLNMLSVLAVGFGLMVALNTVATFLRKFVLLSAGTSLGFGITSNLGRHLLRLPIAWFERRHVGDILSRLQSVQPIQSLLTNDAVGAVVDGTLIVLTFVLMVIYSGPLASVAVVALGLYLLVRFVLLSRLREAGMAAAVAQGSEQSNIIESIRAIATLRLFNREMLRHLDWQSKLVASFNSAAQVSRISIWQSTAGTLLFGIENVVAVFIGIRLIIGGGFTAGMLFAYLAYKLQFIQTAQSLIDRFIEFRLLSVHLDRLSDIALSEQDVSFGDNAGARTEFQGTLTINAVSYRYSQVDPYVLNDVSFQVSQGEYIAITGASGGGKTTLAKVLLGLVEPTSGEVLVDGKPLAQFGYRTYRDQIAAVLQDDNLFLGSIADNIALFDEQRNMEKIVRAAQSAAVHDEILAMPMNYQTLVGNMGASLSGGQKQRILLARALYREPKLLVMDEGTAHLDIDNERKVNLAISELGITRIIIAHRQETVESAQRVLVMREGRISERFREVPRRASF